MHSVSPRTEVGECFRTVSASPLMFDKTVMCTSWVIATSPEVPVGKTGPKIYNLPAVEVTRASSVVQFLGLLSRTYAATGLGEVFVVFVFARTFSATMREDISSGGWGPVAAAADDCVASGLDDPNIAVRCELFPGSESLCSLLACATVRDVLSAGPSGASDWVGFQDLYDSARGIIDLCNDREPRGGRVITIWTAESPVRILGVQWFAVYRWKPGISVAATSYSVPGHRRMSGVVPSPVSACRSCLNYECCSGGITPEWWCDSDSHIQTFHDKTL